MVDIYRKWTETVRREPDAIDVELHSLVDELVDSGVIGRNSGMNYLSSRMKRKH